MTNEQREAQVQNDRVFLSLLVQARAWYPKRPTAQRRIEIAAAEAQIAELTAKLGLDEAGVVALVASRPTAN